MILKLGVVALCAIALGAFIIWDKQHAPLANAPTTGLLPSGSQDSTQSSGSVQSK